MALKKVKLGDLIASYKKKCNIPNLSPEQVSGVNRDKEFFEPSNQVGSDTSNYQEVPPRYFACNLMHVGRDVVLPIAFNHSDRIKYISPAYSVFFIKKDASMVLDEYLFMLLKSSEKDRFFWFQTDASVRDGMSWNDFCSAWIELPPIDVQKKYVDIYLAMLANQRAYEQGLDDLKLVCDAYIEDLRRKMPSEEIGEYLILSDRRNDLNLSVDFVRGLATSKEMIPTKADMDGVKLDNYKLVLPGQIAYVSDTSRRADKISLGYNNTKEPVLVSSISIVFGTDEVCLSSNYLMLFLTRGEFDRYARFNSWGSARETFSWDEMKNIKIPIPSINVQKSIAELYKVYNQRKEINEKLKAQIKNICPILVRGSLEEEKI